MDKTTHELVKTYVMKNEGAGAVYLSEPNFWFEASRLNCWFAQ